MTNPDTRESEAQDTGFPRAPKKGKKYFDLDEANRSIGYVSRVTEDLMAAYRSTMDVRRRIEHPVTGDSRKHLEADYEESMENLGDFIDELHKVGVELKDFEIGLVDFPAVHPSGDREINFSWQYGEKAIKYWHEVGSGFAGRRHISTLEKTAKNQSP